MEIVGKSTLIISLNFVDSCMWVACGHWLTLTTPTWIAKRLAHELIFHNHLNYQTDVPDNFNR